MPKGQEGGVVVARAPAPINIAYEPTLLTEPPAALPAPDRIREMFEKLTPSQREALKSIVIGAMSFGSLGLDAHKAIAKDINTLAMLLHGVTTMAELLAKGRAYPMSNSGEGGELPSRLGTDEQSRMVQIASGHFGVTIEYVANASGIQIKINQAAKPGLGGELLAVKVTPEIAAARLVPQGIDLKSPPPHHDLYSVEELKQLILELRIANPNAFISVKLAAQEGIGIIAAALVKCGADDICIAGKGGGTGAAPTDALYNFARPWETALAEVHQTLIANGIRDRVTLTVSGGIQTGFDLFLAKLLGADLGEIGTPALVALGCVMARVCHDGTCPKGIATNNPDYTSKFEGKYGDVAQMLVNLATSYDDHLQEYGLTTESARGRTDLLRVKEGAPFTNLETLLVQPENPYKSFTAPVRIDPVSTTEQYAIEQILQGKTDIVIDGNNTNTLGFGARIGYHSVKTAEFQEAFVNPVTITFNGLAVGSGFGTFAPAGLTLVAQNGNDGSAKSLSGADVFFTQSVGNQAGLGATSGRIFAPVWGDRPLVRNSGAIAVAERIGDCGANYMTGGSLTILGDTVDYPITFTHGNTSSPMKFRSDRVGPNFGSGMTGGHVFMPRHLYEELLRKNHLEASFANVQPQHLNEADAAELAALVKDYLTHNSSDWVKELVEQENFSQFFIKLDPRVLKPVLQPASVEPVKSPDLLPVPEIVIRPPSAVPAQDTETPTVASPEHLAIPKEEEEKDACGVGTFINLKGDSSRTVTDNALTMLERMMHRGASGVDKDTGDGCGIVWYGLEGFFQTAFPDLDKKGIKLERGNYSVITVGLGNEDSVSVRNTLSRLLGEEFLVIASERAVPTDRGLLGPIGERQEKDIKQYLVMKPFGLTQEEFENRLIRTRLRSELDPKTQAKENRSHIYSASSNNVIYKALVLENRFKSYFKDFSHPAFKASAAVSHARFSTNTKPVGKNVQPTPNVANNGENDNIVQLMRQIMYNPSFAKLLGIERIDISGLSDSHVMSIAMDFFRLLGFSAEEIAALTIQAYNPNDPTLSQFYNLFGSPFEGPNASIMIIGDKIIVVRDLNGFRPQRGIRNKEFFYSGSEIGPVDEPFQMEGELFDIPPGKPVVIDLKTGTVAIDPFQSFAPGLAEKLKAIEAHLSADEMSAALVYSPEDLSVRKLRAGWDAQIDRKFMQPLFNGGKGSISSMGDQGPDEASVSGGLLVLGNAILGNVAQITNPPLDRKREGAYMQTITFLGKKPALERLRSNDIEGVTLPSPIISNEQMALLQNDSRLRSEVIDITIPLNKVKGGLEAAIKNVVAHVLQLVRSGTTFITLSDLNVDNEHAAIPPLLVASRVDQALLEAGLRRNVSIGLQAASVLTVRDVAQAISIGGVDVVNPYLPLTPTSQEEFATPEFKRRSKEYIKQLTLGLQDNAARMGISSISAYRGTKVFSGYGLSDDIAKMLGIPSILGGIGLSDVENMVVNTHCYPNPEGNGKYEGGSEQRTDVWGDGVAADAARIISGKSKTTWSDMEAKMKARQHAPRSYLYLVPPKVWTAKNPMTVCILGGGAAGFFQAKTLLDSGLPVKIVIIEKNPRNQFGLVVDGIAPDHAATKSRSELLHSVLDDPRVKYFGGIEVGDEGDNSVSFAHLQKTYPCIVDCRGASVDNKLNVPGENISYVIPASVVYKSYNGAVDLDAEGHKDWWLTPHSRNLTVGIIGNGNVAGDIARIFLTDPRKLAETSIHPIFLNSLKTDAPQVVRVFARGNAHETKIDLHQLKALEALGIQISVSMPALKEGQEMTDEQRALYDFFAQYENKSYAPSSKKTLYFHFGMKPQKFEAGQKEVTGFFTDSSGNIVSFDARNFITAIGTKPLSTIQKTPYASGWVAGQGGTLDKAETSAQATTDRIVNDFKEGKFHNTLPPPFKQRWHKFAQVTNGMFLNIRAYVASGGRIDTEDGLEKGKAYSRGNGSSAKLKVAPQPVPAPAADVDRDTIRVEDKDGNVTVLPIPEQNVSLLEYLGKAQPGGKVPEAECAGKGNCATCAVDVLEIEDLVPSHRKEQGRDVGDKGERRRLSCLHQTDEFKGQGAKVKIISPQNAPAPAVAPTPAAKPAAPVTPIWLTLFMT